MNIENIDKYCFIWSLLASLHRCKDNRPNRVSNYKQYFNDLNIQCFGFNCGLKCDAVHRFNELNNLSINKFELKFYQDQNKWRHKLIPIEISKNNSHRVIDLAIYKNHYVLIKKLDVFLDHNKKYIGRQCLSSYTSENMLMIHQQKCGEDNITTIKISNESHLHWKKHQFHKNPLYFRIYADFEADNEIDNSSIGKKTTNIYKQNPVHNSYHIISESEDVLKSGCYKSPLGYDNVHWFVNEVIKLEKKWLSILKTLIKISL